MFDAEAVKERFGKEAENLQQTAARLGFPVWTSDEILTIKGVNWTVEEIRIGTKEIVLKYHSKAAGIAAMMGRIQGQFKAGDGMK